MVHCKPLQMIHTDTEDFNKIFIGSINMVSCRVNELEAGIDNVKDLMVQLMTREETHIACAKEK